MLEPLIAQIRDLFPELGEGFLAQCLAYFDNNTERVINALLEDNLPPHLAKMDRALAKPPQPLANVDQDQGSLLKGIDNKTVKRQGISIFLHMFSSQQHSFYQETKWFKIAVLC